MRVLLTGGTGQLGRCLRDCMPSAWQVAAPARHELDIRDRLAVAACVARVSPALIINAAAHTGVDRAEDEADAAYDVNAQGAGNLAHAAAQAGARMVHVSTDYVFSGNLGRPYREADATGPLNVYGKSKLAGEIAVAQALPDALIIRTSWVFSEYGHNFVRTMLRLAVEGAGPMAAACNHGPSTARTAAGRDAAPIRVVNDQWAYPTYAGDLAVLIVALARQRTGLPAGLFHYCGSGVAAAPAQFQVQAGLATAGATPEAPVSWHAFAQSVFACAAQLDMRFTVPRLEAVSSHDYPRAAIRPACSALSGEKLAAWCADVPDAAPALRSWRAALPGVVGRLLGPRLA